MWVCGTSKPAIIKADTAAFGKLVKGGGDLVGHGKEMGSRLGRQVVPAVGFLARYDQQVPPGYWLDLPGAMLTVCCVWGSRGETS